MHLLEDSNGAHYLTRISVKKEDRVLFLKVEDVAWIESPGQLRDPARGPAALHLAERLSALEAALDPTSFSGSTGRP